MKKYTIQLATIPVLIGGVFLFILFSCADDTAGGNAHDDLVSEQDFLIPPATVKPWVYYWWLKGNVSRNLISRDLEQMKEKGIGGFLLFDSRGYWDDYYGRTGHIPVPLEIQHEFMSPEWREMVKYTMSEAKRLGLKMSINLANTGGALRGPWDMKEDGPKQLIWTAADLRGPAQIEAQLKNPAGKKHFKEVALIAVRIEPMKHSLDKKQAFDLNGKWRTVAAQPDNAPVALEVIDLRDNVKGETFQWDAPQGEWRIIRFACHVIGEEGGVDILDADAVKNYFRLMGLEILKDAGPLAGETFTHFYNVSWEGGLPDWTRDFHEKFMEYRGYALNSYLPVLAGLSLRDSSLNKRFMRDYLKTVSECFTENCYKTIGRLCHERGLQWHSENGGPWPRNAPMFREADQLVFWGTNDMPQGEFWCDKPDILNKKSNVRYAAMAAHTYGRRLVSVEAFTHMNNHWTMYPAYLKPFADVNFIDGANFFVWHTFTASPTEVGKPGYEYFAGTHINPNVTWFDKSAGFFDYLARCQYLLRKGKYVADVCCYVSDKNYRKWGRGEKWNPNSSLIPAGGSSYDLLTSEALVERLSVKNGQLVLPDGMSYQLLVLDLEEAEMPVQVLQKITELVKDGASLVLGKVVPTRATGLSHYPESDHEIKAMAEMLWGHNKDQKCLRSLGKGSIFMGYSIKEVLTQLRILPDFEGPYQYLHRKSAGQDIYFISGEGQAECRFRVEGKKPEIWNPVTGEVTEAAIYGRTEDDRMLVALNLPENGSAFVVFREETADNSIVSIEGPEPPEIDETASSSFTFWKSGDYCFRNSAGQSRECSVQLDPSIDLSNSWKVLFEAATGARKDEKVFDQLILWHEHPEIELNHFSGTATYSKSFDLPPQQTEVPARLQLGNVHHIARVWLNGRNLGILWTAPWSVQLTGYLQEGKNELKVEVTNCWANRLIGDAGLPEDRRTTETNVRLVPDRSKYQRGHQATAASDPLLPSGLAGPVYIEFGRTEPVVF
ncbi:MAG: hypothetical protein CSA04_04155 [Bacteroidetes bacterium]|nr:MAG: hypothetical protein CSA04_04155 [Bacteroidota bacterium]